MSYDISFKVKVEGTNKYIEVGNCEANITYNAREIITRSTGLEWKNGENNGLCTDIIPFIEKGYNELRTNPNKYKQYEPKNNCETVRATSWFFLDIIYAWKDICENEVPEIIKVATFWIE